MNGRLPSDCHQTSTERKKTHRDNVIRLHRNKWWESVAVWTRKQKNLHSLKSCNISQSIVPKINNDDSHMIWRGIFTDKYIWYLIFLHVSVQNGSDVKLVDGGKQIFKVSTVVLSTVYTQVEKSHSLRWKCTAIFLICLWSNISHGHFCRTPI